PGRGGFLSRRSRGGGRGSGRRDNGARPRSAPRARGRHYSPLRREDLWQRRSRRHKKRAARRGPARQLEDALPRPPGRNLTAVTRRTRDIGGAVFPLHFDRVSSLIWCPQLRTTTIEAESRVRAAIM